MFKSMICFTDRRVIPWLMALFFFLGLIIPCNALSTTSAIPQVLSKKVTEPDTATRARLMESYGWLPLSFEANHGQTDEKVKFLSRGQGYSLFLTSTEAVLSLRKARLKDKADRNPTLQKADKPEPATIVTMKLVGANPDPKIAGANQLPGKINYFHGNDPKKWRTNIPTYGKVRYTNIYPGIDLVYYGNGRKLEYDFIVASGADPDTIVLSFGQMPVKINPNGDLVLDTKQGDLRLQKPVIYQDIDGIRKPVTGGYVLHPMKNEKQTHQVGFKLAAYDRARPLVIDPVLVYSTYLGGSNTDSGNGIAVDATGNCYVTGNTKSADFPTQDPLYLNLSGQSDVFVTKLSPLGNSLLYSTYLGGTEFDNGRAIAVDSSGCAYVAGSTESTNFPMVNAYQDTLAGSKDVFVTKLSASGASLVYSTYLGGTEYDTGQAIAVDSSGRAYVTGHTYSSNFPTLNAYQGTKSDGISNYEAFVAMLNASGTSLGYSTYLGGIGNDGAEAIAVDSSGCAYITGRTAASDFPVVNAYQGTKPGYSWNWAVFVSKLSATGTSLLYSTYLAGTEDDYGEAIAVDSSGCAYVTGRTFSSDDFPVVNAYQDTCGGYNDAFVTKLSATGTSLVFSTYLGGAAHEYSRGIAVDSSGCAYVTGFTYSTDFPLANAYQNTYGGGEKDAFVTKLSPLGKSLLYSTYLGGTGSDYGQAIAVDSSGCAYVTGFTYSTEFPTQDPLYPNYAGGVDAFVCKISSVTKDELAIDFKTLGIYVYDAGIWNRIYQGVDPEGLCSFGTYLAVDFGTAYGLYVYDAGSWTRVYKGVAIEKMTGFGEKLAVDFGASYPLYEYDFATDTWTPIYNYSSPRDTIEALGDKLVVDFKTAGIYVYDAGIWNRIYKGVDPVNIVSFGDKLAIDFGTAHGLYVYEYDTDNWTRVYKGVAIEKMAEIDGDLAIDFGTAYGLYVYEFDTDNWTRVYKGVAIEKMAGFDGNLAVDFGTTYPIYEYDFDTDNWNSIYQYSSPRDELVPANILD